MKLNLKLHHISSGRWSTELIFSSFEWGGVTGYGLHDRWHPMKDRGTNGDTCKNQ